MTPGVSKVSRQAGHVASGDRAGSWQAEGSEAGRRGSAGGTPRQSLDPVSPVDALSIPSACKLFHFTNDDCTLADLRTTFLLLA
jgi:hypothetical protein